MYIIIYVCEIMPKYKIHGFQVKTRIGKLSKKEGTSKAHHGIFDEDDEMQMKQKVNWKGQEPFYVIPMLYR